MNAVAAGLRSHVKHRIADAARPREEKLLSPRDPQRQRIHQRVTRIAWRESNVAAHRRHSETISVEPDAAHHAIENAPVLARFCRSHTRPIAQWAKSQRIQYRDRPRAHRENIAQDAADARGSSLKGLHVAWMVVRLNFESRA